MQLVPVTPAQLVVVLGTMEQFLAPCSPLCPPPCSPLCPAKTMPTKARRTTADFILKVQSISLFTTSGPKCRVLA